MRAGDVPGSEDRGTVERLAGAWLAETERYDTDAAREARTGWDAALCPSGLPRTWPPG